MSQWLSGKRLALVGPTEGLCHRPIEVVDKSQHFRLEISYRRKSAALEQLTRQNAEPNLNLVHPGSGLRWLVKHKAMRWVRKKSSPTLHRSQNAGFTFDPQVNS
jgi:hypothetical protein